MSYSPLLAVLALTNSLASGFSRARVVICQEERGKLPIGLPFLLLGQGGQPRKYFPHGR
jgi:hypothetical protein